MFYVIFNEIPIYEEELVLGDLDVNDSYNLRTNGIVIGMIMLMTYDIL